MGFPSAHLAVSRAVPLVLALRAPLSGVFTAVAALGVLHELLVHVRGVQLHYPVHVLLERLLILSEEILDLVLSYLLPVPTFHYPCP